MTAGVVENRVVALGQLDGHPRNYNRHSPAQIERLRASLRRYRAVGGQVRSIVVHEQAGGLRYRIVAGHGIVEAARAEGFTELRADVLPASMSETEALAYLAADNELARLGDPDEAMLAGIVIELGDVDAELAALAAGTEERLRELVAGVQRSQQEDPGAQIDKADELREKWQTAPGQLWQLGEHRLVCGDCTDAAVVTRVMDGDMAELVVTDPPYGVEYADKNKFLNAVAFGNRIQTDIEGDHGTKEETQALWKAAFSQMGKVMAPGAVVYCFMPQGGDQMMMMMMMMMMGAGIEPRHELIWVKNNHVLGRVDYAYKHEPILYAWKDGGHKFYGDFQTSILEFPKPQQSNLHPTMKPVELIERLLSNSSKVTGLVFDPFLGSGTTLIACEKLGRRCRAVEIEPKYTAVALERWAVMTEQTPLLVSSGG